jgi:hypothetical protein
MTQIIITSITALLVAFISANKISDFRKKSKTIRHNKKLIHKAKTDRAIFDLLEKLYKTYNVDRVVLYFFHNGMKASNGFSFYKFSCYHEVLDHKKLKAKKEEQQNMPVGLMSDLFGYYLERGALMCPSHDCEALRLEPNFKFYLDSMDLKSTYSNIFKNLDGEITCCVMMNMETEPKEINDLDLFNKVGHHIAQLLTEA